MATYPPTIAMAGETSSRPSTATAAASASMKRDEPDIMWNPAGGGGRVVTATKEALRDHLTLPVIKGPGAHHHQASNRE